MQDCRRALRPFRRKLILEAALHAAAFGMAVCAAGVAAYMAALLFFPGLPRPGQYARAFAALCCAAGCARYALGLHPTRRRTAARIDRMGLEERVSTMVAFYADPSFLCAAQRRDALDKLSRVRARQLALAYPKRALALCAALSALALGLSLIPTGAPRAVPETAGAEVVESEEARLIREMISGLRERIESSGIDEAEMDLLLAQLEALEAGVMRGHVTLQDLAEASEAAERIAEDFESGRLFQSWAFALLQHESLRALGIAILEENVEKVHLAFDGMEARLLGLSGSARADALGEIARAAEAALADKEPRDSEKELAGAIGDLGGDLARAAMDAEAGKDAAVSIKSGVLRARERVVAYLTEAHDHDPSEANLEKDDHIDEDTHDDAIPPDAGGESARGQPAVNSETGAKMEEGANHRMMYGAQAQGGFDTGSGTMDRQYHAVTELVYEPSLDPAAALPDYVPGALGADGAVQRVRASEKENEGTVPYGQVQGIYLARLLEQLSAGEIPDEYRGFIEAYFYGL